MVWAFGCACIVTLVVVGLYVREIFRRRASEQIACTAEDRFARLVANMPGTVFQRVSLPDGSFRYNFLGGRVEEIFGKPIADIMADPSQLLTSIHPDDRERFLGVLKHAADTLTPFFIEQRTCPRPGEIRWVHTNSMPTPMPNGEVVWDGLVMDVSEYKQIEQEVRIREQEAAERMKAARDAAEEASRIKSEFLANVSHEIRTPIHGIMGMNSLLLRTRLTSEQKKFAEAVKHSADSLLTIVSDILDISKLEAGKVELESVDFSLESVVEGAVELLAPRAQEKQIEIAAWIDDDVRSFLQGDPTRLRQVLLNLLANAIKFTDRGFVTVEAHALTKTPEKVKVRLEVHDTGIGIPEATKARLFEKFEQADSSVTRKFGGTGLGLSICKQLVSLMEGEIGVIDRPGGGSIFWVQLELTNGEMPSIRSARSLDGLRGKRALVVDDVEINRIIFHRQLLDVGMHVESVADGGAALVKLREAHRDGHDFDFVLLDQMMPLMAGEDVAEIIRSSDQWGQPKLILVSSVGMPVGGDKAARVGFDAFLAKPLRRQALLDCLAGFHDGEFTVPATPPAETMEAPPVIPTPPSSLGGHILVTEDNETNREIANLFLRDAGYTVDTAGNGQEAIAAATTRLYDVILMDVQMPVMDGLQATQEIRRQNGPNANTPIIAMTANAMRGDKERCMAVGMNDYVGKPVDPDEFLTTIAKWIRKAEPVPAQAALAQTPVQAATTATTPQQPAGPATVAVADLLDEPRLIALQALMKPQQIEKIAQSFLDDAEQRVSTFGMRLGSQEWQQLSSDAHTLIGAAGNIGAAYIARLARRLEDACHGDDQASAAAVLPHLVSAIPATRQAIVARFMPVAGSAE